MKPFTNLMASVVLGLAVGVTAMPAAAETPPNMLVIANRIDDITTLDPAESFEFAGSDVSRNVYGKLVNFDPMDLDAGYGPDLAESWTVSEDGMTITFKMREGVKFHSGNPVTAKDAEFSLRRAVILNKTPSFILTQFGFTADNVAETIKADRQHDAPDHHRQALCDLLRAELSDLDHRRHRRQQAGHGQRG